MDKKYYDPLSDMSRIKNSIMSLLCSSEDITKLIMPILDDSDLTPEQNWYGGTFDKNADGQTHTTTLIGHCFDTPYIEGTLSANGCAVYIETYLTKMANQRIKEVGVDITVLCHRDCVRLSDDEKQYYNSIGVYGNRVDSAIQLINSSILNSEIKDQYSIGNMNMAEENPITRYMSGADFYGKCLSYKYQTFYRKNTQLNGGRP